MSREEEDTEFWSVIAALKKREEKPCYKPQILG
jgi:hypothetical protein